MAFSREHIKWFRDSSPYINAHRGRTFVVCLASDALRSSNLENVLGDLALLNSLGIRLVVVFGGDHQVREALDQDWESAGQRRITTPGQIQTVSAVLGRLQMELTARFSALAPDQPGGPKGINVCTGNFVRAQPIGIVNGVDHLQSGNVRSISSEAIRHQLDMGAIVLVPSLGFSPSGETFHLEVDTVARETACATGADKLIYLTGKSGLHDKTGSLVTEVDLSGHDTSTLELDGLTSKLLGHCDVACGKGVARCHIISFETDGALLEELFTRDGCGTQIVGHSYERIRQATTEDVPGILKLITPLEESGVLVKRSRELIEAEIEQFIVIERDGLLVSCAALYEFGSAGELACLVTHPDYRNGDRGDRLLDSIEKNARDRKLEELFVLTTQSAHWFMERGFQEATRDVLPAGKKQLYNDQRSSRVLRKQI